MNAKAVVTVIAGHVEHTFTATITDGYTFHGHTFYEYALPTDAPAAVRIDYLHGFTSVPASRVVFAL